MSSSELLVIALIALGAVGLLWLAWAFARMRLGAEASPDTAYTRGLSALIGGDRREALRCLREAVDHDSENLDAYIRLGDLLREGGEPSKALAVHRDLTVRPRLADADRVRILESITRDYLAARRHEEAGQSADRLRKLNNNHRFAHRALQQVAEALEDWPRAIQAVTEQTRLEGGDGKARRARYLCFVAGKDGEAGRTDEARRRYHEALKLDDGCLAAHLRLGDMLYADGDSPKAVEHWRTLADRSPEKAVAVFGRLERAYFEMGQFGEVIGFYRELLHRMPREASVPALLALAEIHRRKGELEEAENFVQEALDIDPDHPLAHRHLVRLAVDRGDAAEALARVDRLLESTDEGHAAEDELDAVAAPTPGDAAPVREPAGR